MSRVDVVVNLIRSYDCKSYCEVGVKQGRMFQQVVRATGVYGIAVDPFENIPNEGESYDEWDFETIRKEFLANTAGLGEQAVLLQMTSLQAADRVKHVDLVFIDAAHDYENVKADIEAWRPKCNVLSGHDYDEKFPGVIRAVDELVSKPGELHLEENAVWWCEA